MLDSEENKNSKFKKWIQRVGWIGVAFFTLKGLAWLVVFYYGAESLNSCMK
jgi:hypothetical protein